MYKKLFFLLLLMVCSLPINVYSENNIKVGFFPFNIYANKDIQPLKNKIPKMIAGEIKKAEAQFIIIDQQYNDVDFNYEQFKKIGIEYEYEQYYQPPWSCGVYGYCLVVFG